MTKLSVNVNKVATLRNQRPQLNIPDLVRMARICLDAGAHGITIHPRPDERHIRGTDVPAIAQLVAQYPAAEFNIEGNPFEGEYMNHCRRTRPTQATLVPDTLAQSTSDHGWDLAKDGVRLRPIIAELRSLGCRVSLFMDADGELMRRAADAGAHRAELYTEPFAAAFARGDRAFVERYADAARRATDAGLELNAGHDLNLDNLPFFLSRVPNVLEVSIGHALIGDALELGLVETVHRYLQGCSAR
ncbi:MAG: pyridoxine 5'-phosphate synthase [Tepidisphaeraceae bacterium]